MPEFTLPRDGDIPISFDGDLISKSTSHEHEGPGQNRWHELSLFRTGKGKYALAITYHSLYRGEGSRHHVAVCGSVQDVREVLTGHDPVPRGIGFPSGRDYQEKQSRMIDNLNHRYRRAVSELFKGLGAELSEWIE